MTNRWRRVGSLLKEQGKRPLDNVWLGVSVEDQATANKRIPELLRTPAAVRFVSYEPALAGVDFRPWLPVETIGGVEMETWLDWIIVGGESGPGVRPFDLEWARETIRQCKAAGVAVFVKQLGARPVQTAAGCLQTSWPITDPKGGNWDEWPMDLRIREFPR
jgi:protein gp37